MYSINDMNCWTVNLKPFDEKLVSDDTIKDFQLKCIENRIFGIGWHIDGFTGALEDNKDAFLAAWSKSGEYARVLPIGCPSNINPHPSQGFAQQAAPMNARKNCGRP